MTLDKRLGARGPRASRWSAKRTAFLWLAPLLISCTGNRKPAGSDGQPSGGEAGGNAETGGAQGAAGAGDSGAAGDGISVPTCVDVYPDEDGDGYALLEDGVQQCGGPVPTGFTDAPRSLARSDCDDSDATIHPSAELEVAGDGVDSDCDGEDYPATCVEPADACQLGLDPAQDWSVAPSCQEADPRLVEVGQCSDCGRPVICVVVGNQGESDTSGLLALRFHQAGSDPVTVLIQQAMEPGRLLPPRRFFSSQWSSGEAVDVELIADVDCDPSNNRETLEPLIYDCR